MLEWKGGGARSKVRMPMLESPRLHQRQEDIRTNNAGRRAAAHNPQDVDLH